MDRAWEGHSALRKMAEQSIQLAVKIRALLIRAQQELPYGDFKSEYESRGFKRTTVYSYIAVAHRWDGKLHMLEDGVKLCDLYRELGLMRPLQGGGRRLGKFELDRRNAARQLIFDFDSFSCGLAEVLRFEENGKNPFSDLARDQIEAEHAKTKRVLALQEEALRTVDA